jgi:hypothetical protein
VKVVTVVMVGYIVVMVGCLACFDVFSSSLIRWLLVLVAVDSAVLNCWLARVYTRVKSGFVVTCLMLKK